MSVKRYVVIAATTLVMLVLWAGVAANESYADIPSYQRGRAFMMVGGTKVYLPGVRIHRLDKWKYDYCGGGDCYGYLHGVEVITGGDGRYHMGNVGNNPAPVCNPDGGPAWLCQTGELNKSIRTQCNQGLNWCGFNCGSNPHIWRAYFRDGYSWIKNNYPQVPFKDNDIDGGGTWVLSGGCGASEYTYHGAQWWRKSVDNQGGSEGCGFEWIPPACHLTCTASATPSTVSHAGGGTVTLNANVQGTGYDSVTWSWKPGTTPCGTLRTDPNVQTRAYVDFTNTDVCTGQVVALASNACTASCNTSFTITNAAPQVVSVSPTSGLSGTEPQDDNGPGCSDRNPQIYTVTYRDADGCSDISRAYFWVDNVSPSVTTLHSSARASVQKSGSDWRIYGLRCLSGCDVLGNWSWSLGGAVASQFEPSSPYIYSPNNAGITTDCTSHAGGCSEAVAGVRPYAAACSGNDLTVKYKVWYYDDDIANSLNTYGYVSDYPGAHDGWDDIGNWSLDFDHPQASISTQHNASDDPDEVRFPQNASDDGVYDSGLASVINRRYWIMREGIGRLPSNPNQYYSAGGNVYGLGGADTWSAVFGPEDGFQGGDVIYGEISAVDRACNMSTDPYQSDEIGHEWIQTFGGSVYGLDRYYDPIPITGEHLAEFWLGSNNASGCAPGNFNDGVGSLMSPWWCSYNYGDQNRRSVVGSWYDTLYRLALRSTFVKENYGGTINSVSSVDFGDGTDLVVKYTGALLDLHNTCDGRKIVFVPNGRNIRIRPNFEVAGPGDACLVIAERNVATFVRPGDQAVDDVDDIDVALVTDGRVQFDVDAYPPVYDRLLLNGMVFSDDALFLRDLVWEDNTADPAETVAHDARYIYLLRDMLGSRNFTDFECGIVQGSPKCEGW